MASSTEFIGKSTVTSPSAVGVISAEKALSLPTKLVTLPLAITKSEASKLTTSLLKFIATGIGFVDVGLLAEVVILTVSSSTLNTLFISPALTLTLSTVALIAELVLLYTPVVAPEGTLIGTSKEQLAPGSSSPPEKKRFVVPDILELIPHGLLGKLVADMLLITEVKLSENDIAVAAAALAEFERV